MSIHIYAEHLINIRTLTIQISLPTNSNENTKITLSADGAVLSVTHRDETAAIALPLRGSTNSSNTFSVPSVPSRILSFRMRLEEKPGASDSQQNGQKSETVIPWTAASLSDKIEMQCKSCASLIVPRGSIQTWKDLPSEGWAEMMEFWHCHKPNEPDSHDHQTDKKGYSADSTLAISSSVGLVNATSFVLATDDCRNIKVLEPHNAGGDYILVCTTCDAPVGTTISATQGYKLSKRSLNLSTSTHGAQSLDDAKLLSCHLLNSMDNQGLRKFIITSGPEQPKSLLVWLFTPDLTVASSQSAIQTPLRVTKVLWKEAPAQAQNALLDTQSMTEGEIEMPEFELLALRKALGGSAALLPESGRQFLEWKVALLERFTVDDAILL